LYEVCVHGCGSKDQHSCRQRQVEFAGWNCRRKGREEVSEASDASPCHQVSISRRFTQLNADYKSAFICVNLRLLLHFNVPRSDCPPSPVNLTTSTLLPPLFSRGTRVAQR